MTEPTPAPPSRDDIWFLHNFIDKPNKPSEADIKEMREIDKRIRAKWGAASARRRQRPTP